MKTSFVQIFDKENDALEALGFMTRTYASDRHQFVKSSNQIQFWTKLKGIDEAKTFGAPNSDVIYMVVSSPPE